MYTSWTIARGVANFHANKNGKGGIVLVKKFVIGEFLPNPHLSDEGEYLVPGVITGAKPMTPSGPGFPTMFY